jgi:ATP-dependent Clp protease ATP-binding subunit ClpA
LHQHGSGVLLFDEIEKARAEVHRLLGLLDNGRIHSARGEALDTR